MEELNKKIRVLLVDDDFTARLIVAESLKQDYEVLEAENGKEAYELFLSEQPNVILSDVMMPVMDGYELCIKIRQHKEGKYIPIVMMTGLDDFDSIHKAYEKGATDFIMKPVNHLLLMYRLNYLLRAKEIDDALMKSRNRLAMAQKISKLCNWELDLETGLFTYSNELNSLFQLDKNKKIQSIEGFLVLFPNDVAEDMQTTFQSVIKGKNNFSIIHNIDKDNDEKMTIEQIGQYCVDEVTGKKSLLVTLQDISERRNAEVKIKHLSLHDKLTGFPNRVALNSSITKTCNKAILSSTKVILMQVNIDNFNRINSSLGHTVGDNLIRAFAQRLKETLRSQEVLSQLRDLRQPPYESLCHFGGDDFVIVLNNLNHVENTANIARHILKSIESPFVIDEQEFRITSSMGISIFPDDADEGELLLANASAALHKSKEHGRNCYKFFQQSMNARAFEKLSLEMGLRRALEEEQFELFFQPKLNVKEHAVKRVEVLLRWRHPELGLVSPVDFIPIAESSGLIIPISEWIVRQVCALKQRWDNKNIGIEQLSINLSPSHLREQGLVELIKRSLKLFDLPANVIDLEITESIIMNDIDAVVPVLDAMRNIGCSISIDDFGTGYSSLSYLKSLPIEYLKIDRSFVMDIFDANDDGVIVNAIISLAHNLGLKVIAEGVEEERQFNFLAERGCEYIQGYYLTKPLAEHDFIEWLNDWRSKNNMVIALEKVATIY